MTVVLAFVGDLHIGSTVGLCPRRVALDDGGAYQSSKSQRWLWRFWLDYLKEAERRKTALNAQLVLVLNGDLCDRNKHGHYQLWTTNRATLKDGVLASLEPAFEMADYFVVVRGTEAHTGESAEMEEWLADDIGAVPDEQCGSHSWYFWQARIAGHNIGAAHHPPSNSMRPWTLGGGANRTAAVAVHEFYGKRWQPEFLVFNHVHHNEDSYDNHEPLRVVFNRPLSLKTAYDHRSGRSMSTVSVGGCIVEAEKGTKLRVHKPHREPRERKPWTLN